MKFDPATPPRGTVRDWLDHHADADGDRISHLFPETGETLTWAELRGTARAIAGHLTALGIAPGESVAQMLPNGRDAVLCMMGVLYGGFRMTPINLVAGADAISYALEHSEARFAFVGPEQRDLFAQTAGESVRAIPVEGVIDWPEGAGTAPLHVVGTEDDALLMYTSGTTGRPKGVVHSQASLLAGGWTTTLAHDLGPQDRALCILPVYHINGLCVTVIGPLVSGGSVAMCSRFSASRFWRQIEETEATWFSAVPTIISHLVHGEGMPGEAARQRLRFARSASSALAVEVQRAFEGRFGIPIVETMGLTETAAQILSNPLPPGVRKIGSPGIAYGNEAAILGPDLKPLPAGEVGEIAVRGPNVMRGYLKNPEATAGTFAEGGWLRTGDLGREDEDGYIFVTGRLKELIIKGGENIAPREIDEALYSHADVVEAAAFARQCDRYGERVEAAVRLAEGSQVTAAELAALCEARLGSFKCPDVIHVMSELPKGPSGKIQRLKLAGLTTA
ncbi:AMP-binding protein [Rhodobacteraceae bacterium NNCM2]|nr:AMP-binding protein [Coraliihabitans acroporae]